MLTLQHKTSWILLAACMIIALGITAKYVAHMGNHAKVVQFYILPVAFEAHPVSSKHVLLFPGRFSGAAFIITVIGISYGFLANILGDRPLWRLRAAFWIALASYLFVLFAMILAITKGSDSKTATAEQAVARQPA